MSTSDNQETLVASKPHIMFISYALQGHLNPMMQFSKRLVSKGIKVTIVTTAKPNFPSNAKTSSINFEHISVDETSLPADSPEGIDETVARFKVGITQSLPELIEKQKANGCPVKVLVYDALMPWALDLSHSLEIPGVAFCSHSSAVFAIYYNVYSGTLDVDSLGEASTVKLPSLPLLKIKDLPSHAYTRAYHGLSILFASQFLGIDRADCVIFNTFDKLECEVQINSRNKQKLAI